MKRPSLSPNDLALLAATLGLYFGLVHAASFSPGLPSAYLASRTAILLLDALIVALIVGLRPARLRPAAFAAPAALALLVVAALHVDYALARSRGVHDGLLGELPAVKNLLVASQLVLVALLAIIRSGVTLSWALFRTNPSDLALAAVLLAPLVNFFARNREALSPVPAAGYFAWLLVVPLLALLLVQALQRILGARALAAPVVIALALVHYSMPMVSDALARPIETLFAVQVALAVVVPALAAMLYLRHRSALVTGVLLFSTLSVVASLVTAARAPALLSTDVVEAPPDRGALGRALAAPLVRAPDVYLLVYDSYAPSSMLEAYGIDNRAADAFLAGAGFTDYPGAYSLFHATYRSMSAVMSMGPATPAGIGGRTAATEFFRSHGYETQLILHSYLMNASPPGADRTYPVGRQRAAESRLYRGIIGGEFKAEMVFDDAPHDEWVTVKRAALAAAPEQPKMVYAHSPLPTHSQNSGRCLSDETARYARRLEAANDEMRRDVETILATGRESIVIVASDHGPSLTGDCLYMEGTPPGELRREHLADRYGAKLAIRWPDGSPPLYAESLTIQDVLLAVSAYLLEDASVMQHRLPRVITGYGGIPDGAVRDGIVTLGPDRGRPLFDVR